MGFVMEWQMGRVQLPINVLVIRYWGRCCNRRRHRMDDNNKYLSPPLTHTAKEEEIEERPNTCPHNSMTPLFVLYWHCRSCIFKLKLFTECNHYFTPWENKSKSEQQRRRRLLSNKRIPDSARKGKVYEWETRKFLNFSQGCRLSSACVFLDLRDILIKCYLFYAAYRTHWINESKEAQLAERVTHSSIIHIIPLRKYLLPSNHLPSTLPPPPPIHHCRVIYYVRLR